MKAVVFIASLLLVSCCWAAPDDAQNAIPEAKTESAIRVEPEVEEKSPPATTPGEKGEVPTPATSEVEAGFEVNYSLRRNLNGRRFSREGVRLPDSNLSFYRTANDTTLGVSSDVEITRMGREGHLLETEFYAYHSLQKKNLRIEPGVYLYLRDHDFGPSTGELSLSVSERTGKVRWFADAFVDVLHSPGDYLVQGGVSYRTSPDERSLVKTSFLVGTSSERVDDDLGFFKENVYYATASASWTRDLSSHWAIRPRVEATRYCPDHITYMKFTVALLWTS